MTVVVSTWSGPVQGRMVDGVAEFLGMPYASPVTGIRRWTAPNVEEPWREVRPAVRLGPSDRQAPPEIPGFLRLLADVPPATDAMLNLNVWTPDPTDNLPVIVFIHGGAFLVGAGGFAAYRGARLAELGAVVVTLNYRLGYAGWLPLAAHFPDTEVVDNRGLLDQIAALQWIQQGIREFGGDPNRVTIAGESAGAVSVAALLGSPAAAPLFRRAVLMSPTFTPFDAEPENRLVAAELLRRVDVPTGDIDALGALDGDELCGVQASLEQDVAASVFDGRFGAASRRASGLTAATNTETLPHHPVTALAQSAGAGKELLVGSTKDEWRAFTRAGGAPVGPMIDSIGVRAICRRDTGFESVLAAYQDLPERDRTEAIMTDGAFRWPASRLLDAHREAAGVGYSYRFDWPSGAYGGELGAAHTVDLPFWFGTPDCDFGRTVTGGAAPRSLVDAMMRSLVAFATCGDPQTPELPLWPPFDDTRPTMLLDTPPTTAYAPDPTLVAWSDTYETGATTAHG